MLFPLLPASGQKLTFRRLKIKFTCCLSIFTGILLLLVHMTYAQHPANAAIKMFRGNSRLTGESNESAVNKLNGIKFRFKAAGPIRSTPASANGLLYFGCGDGNLYAIDNETGKERWRFKTAGAVYSSPAVTSTTVYFSSRDGYLYAVDARAGKELWKFKMGKDLGNENYWDNYLSSPVITGNNLFIGSSDGYLYAFNISTKNLTWKYNAGARIRTTPAVAGDQVVFGSNLGIITSVSRVTGKLQWKFATNGAAFTFESGDNDRKSIYCAAAIQDGVVVTGGRDGIIYALDLKTGKEKWRNDHKGPWILASAIKDGVAYIACGSDYLVQALDLQTGAEKWKLKVPSAVFSAITIAGDMLYFNDIDFSGNLHAVDSKTGIEKWRFPIGTKSFSTPVVANGMVYCGAENGMLYALQGDRNASVVATAAPKKVVYWEGTKIKNDFSYFRNGIDEYIRNYFVAVGYQLMNENQLEQLMKDQLNKGGKSVVVFADNRFPPTITGGKSGVPLVKQYLDAGGKIALLGLNPLAYVRDSTGVVSDLVDSIPGRIFDLKYAEKKFIRGIYQFNPTKNGEKYGLYSSFTGNSNFTVIKPDKSITVLTRDEFGAATQWIKNYGGPDGTGLLQLWVWPNEVSPTMGEIRAAIEYGVCW